MAKFETYLKNRAAFVEKGLETELKKIKNAPQIIIDAMAYSLQAGGKRLRPILTLATAEVFGADKKDILPAACAVEMLHTYSLIHDDLPAMDNDSLRRGRPTNHKVFGEDLAILAGDGLLTYAFETLSNLSNNKKIKPQNLALAIKSLANFGGVSGMIGGQVADIFAEGILDGKSKRAQILLKNKLFKGSKMPQYFLLPKESKEVSAAALLTYIHANKTGALITTAVEIGALLAGANGNNLKNIKTYASKIGFAFQVVDDILDATATAKQLGKSNSDAANKKLTFVILYGLDEAKIAAQKAVESAIKALNNLKGVNKEKLAPLYDLANFFLSRSY